MADLEQEQVKSAAPRPGAKSSELERLSSWVGEWRSHERYEKTEMTPNGGEGRGRATVRTGPGGLIVEEYHSEGGPMGPLEGLLVLTWSKDAGDYVLHWFDTSMPGGMDAHGKWVDDKLVFDGGGGKHRFRMTYSFGDGLRLLTAEDSAGGAPFKKSFAIEYRREH